MVNEAFRAGMHEVIMVVPTTMAKLALVERTFPGKRIRLVRQERALGLANVVLLVKPYVGEEPFALLLPDEVDREMRCLQRRSTRAYAIRLLLSSPLPRSSSRSRNFGIAPLAPTTTSKSLVPVSIGDNASRESKSDEGVRDVRAFGVRCR